jgi:hypothetical protein
MIGPKYHLPTLRGKLFVAGDGGAGIAVGTSIGTTAMLSLYNPSASTVKLVICKVWVGYVSGTLGAGALWHCCNPGASQAAPSGGTLVSSPQNCDLANAATATGVLRYGAVTVASGTVALGPFLNLVASPSNLGPILEDVDGLLAVDPGTSYQIQAVAAAGTNPKVSLAVAWEEWPSGE